MGAVHFEIKSNIIKEGEQRINENYKIESITDEFKKFLKDKNVFNDDIVTEINKFDVFYKAEDDHQEYYDNNKEASYCQFIINPKINKLKAHFLDKLKQDQTT